MSFLPLSVAAYVFNAGAIIIDRILLRTVLPNPTTYTFYVNLLQILVIVLIPFGFTLQFNESLFLAVSSGIISVLAIYSYFNSLKINEASVVGPMIGTFSPLFALIVGGIFLGQVLTTQQYLAFSILIMGTIILTWNFWKKGFRLNKRFLWMLACGFLYGLSYVLLREAFLHSSFLNGFIISRVASGLFVLLFLLHPRLRKEIFTPGPHRQAITSKSTLILLGAGQTMGALSVTILTFAISLASPALVNSFFGVQYMVILIVSLILAKKHPHLLEEHLSKHAVILKLIGAGVISVGLYLLAK